MRQVCPRPFDRLLEPSQADELVTRCLLEAPALSDDSTRIGEPNHIIATEGIGQSAEFAAPTNLVRNVLSTHVCAKRLPHQITKQSHKAARIGQRHEREPGECATNMGIVIDSAP